MELNSQKILESIQILEAIVADPGQLDRLSEQQRVALFKAAGQISRPNRDEIRERNKAIRKSRKATIAKHDREARSNTGIRSARKTAVFSSPLQLSGSSIESMQTPELKSSRTCYVCRAEYTKLHHFYDAMCLQCGDLNYRKRFQTASLKDQVAVITGSRLKIGYQCTLMMLRAGAQVVATTRFPKDSAVRFSKEPDFNEWSDRLQIYGLDLRHIPSVEIFAKHVEQTYGRLDILINNAAQTVRRPPGFYAHLMSVENQDIEEFSKDVQGLLSNFKSCTEQLTQWDRRDLSNEKALPVTWHGNTTGVGLRASAQLSQIPYSYDNSLKVSEVFPEGKLDADLQQVDLRETNSWRLKIGEIETPEMLEVQLVNAVAPFVLCNRMAPLMRKDFTGSKHIVNVSAMEGKFQRFKKEDRHPHTNMAKAALNMLTHTSASDLAKDGIYMNAVDTGWVTDEDPAQLAKFKQDIHDFEPPLDIVDGAARVCDPFFDGIITGKHWSGKFLKDYLPIDW